MKIALVDVDGHGFPNLALMKLSAWHKANGDYVEWYSPLFSQPERIYASRVFTFSKDYLDYNPTHPEPIRGGTGYDLSVKLPGEVDAMLPDYSLYGISSQSYGFLSRGCIRKCSFCIVPQSEGELRVVDDIVRIAGDRREVILMDNNFLANPDDFVAGQLEKAIHMKLKLDFNQGLDARLFNPVNVALLARCKWINYIRMSCDADAVLPAIERAVALLQEAGYTREIFVYVLAKEVDGALRRIQRLIAISNKVVPFCQPFRDFAANGEIIDPELKQLARWCNRLWLRKSCTFAEFRRGRKSEEPGFGELLV